MNVKKDTSAIVVVKLSWANLLGVRSLLRRKSGNAGQDIRGVDDSHVIYAKIADASDPVGLWIDIEWKQSDEGSVKRPMLIPWPEILTIVLNSTEEEARRIGFIP